MERSPTSEKRAAAFESSPVASASDLRASKRVALSDNHPPSQNPRCAGKRPPPSGCTCVIPVLPRPGLQPDKANLQVSSFARRVLPQEPGALAPTTRARPSRLVFDWSSSLSLASPRVAGAFQGVLASAQSMRADRRAASRETEATRKKAAARGRRQLGALRSTSTRQCITFWTADTNSANSGQQLYSHTPVACHSPLAPTCTSHIFV